MKTLIGMLNRLQPRELQFHIKIENPPYMPLTIEGIGTGPRKLPAVSVTHYGEQNGDLMRDPEMCFEMEIQNGGVNPKTETVESATLCIEGSMEWQTTACDIVRRSGWRR